MRNLPKATMVVVNADPREVRAALRCYRAKKREGNTDRAKMALKLLEMIEKFIKQGGRFKKRYTRRKKNE